MPTNHLILCHPFSCCLQYFPASGSFQISQLTSGGQSIKSFSISLSNEHPGLISFRMDWLDLLAVQETLKSLILYHSSKVSILQHSAFFTVQFSHPYMTTGKTIALPKWTFVEKVMSLLFNMLPRLVIGCCLGSLGKEVATHTNILAWKMPWTEEPCRLQFMGSQKVRHDLVTSLSFF